MGRVGIYGEPTTPKTFRLPVSKEKEITKKFNEVLATYEDKTKYIKPTPDAPIEKIEMQNGRVIENFCTCVKQTVKGNKVFILLKCDNCKRLEKKQRKNK